MRTTFSARLSASASPARSGDGGDFRGVGEQLFGISRAVFADSDFSAAFEGGFAVFHADVGAAARAERRCRGNRLGADSEAAEIDSAAFAARVRIEVYPLRFLRRGLLRADFFGEPRERDLDGVFGEGDAYGVAEPVE